MILVMKVNTDHDRTRDKNLFTNVNAARYGLRDLMKEYPKVYEEYVKFLRAQRKQNGLASRPPSSAPSKPNPADIWREKWRKEELAKEAWQREQDRAREAALNQARQKAAKMVRVHSTANRHKKPRQSAASSPVQEQRQKQTVGRFEPNEPTKDPDNFRESSSLDWSEVSADQRQDDSTESSRTRGEVMEQQPTPTETITGEANIDSLNPRLVLIHGLPPLTTESDIYETLTELKPGAVAHMKLVETSAWIEFYRPEAAATILELATTEQLSVRGELVSNVTVQSSPLRPPPQESFTSRVLLVTSLDEKLFDWKSKGDRTKFKFHLRQCGVGSPVETIRHTAYKKTFLRIEYASWREQAENVKAYIENTAPSLQVEYGIDPCRPEDNTIALEGIVPKAILEGTLSDDRRKFWVSFSLIAIVAYFLVPI
ncbi:hypothetical protein N0V93_006907 [Gnomoniopsis smithogilvyi]|uniref:RRM domain-containing protein n=1 Tax=Gnomoniopsis smithogilvyi TaxID=1191159 RepID=A0A9W8YQQ9_9PEZI|nr:hypothetical protein N0V93_006907 [Gnomoniopsis smithogilvyi]